MKDRVQSRWCRVSAGCLCMVLVIGICPALSGDAPTAEEPAEPLVTNVWVETEVRQVIQDISLQTGVPIICDHTVQGVVTIAVQDMPLEDVLERVCAVGGYDFLKINNYYVVGKADPGSLMFARTASSKRASLTYVNCDQVRAALHPSLAQFVTYDKPSGTVIITAPEAARQKVIQAIREIDHPHRHVIIEAVVLELTEEGAKQLGLDWQYGYKRIQTGMSDLVGTVTYDAASDIARYIEVTLRAIIQERKGRVLASPRIAVMNGEEADIFVGLERYFSLLSGPASNPYYRLESIKAGVNLTVGAQIGANGQMVLKLAPEVSDVATETARDNNNNSGAAANSALPVVTRRRANTTISVRDGQTIVLGGLLREQHRSLVEKVPVLGDIPVLGTAFRKVTQRKEQQEVIIVMTAHLVDGNDSRAAELPSRLEQRYISPLDSIAPSADQGEL